MVFPKKSPSEPTRICSAFSTAGTLSENAPQAIEASYNVVGYGAKLAADAAGGPPVIGDVPMDGEEAFRQVGRICFGVGGAERGLQVSGAINPALLVAAAKFVMKYVLPLLLK